MAYNTGNAIGSNDPRDLFDNAGNLDKLVNGPAQSYPDRLGVSRKSLAGMEADFQTFLLASGYQDIGEYPAIPTITARNQIFLRAGEYYRVAAPTALPFTVTGVWATDEPFLVAVGDAVLRQDLENWEGLAGLAVSIIVGDGVTDKSGEIVAANALGRPLLFVGIAEVTSSVTITVPIVDTLSQIFTTTSDVTVDNGSFVRPDWFGMAAGNIRLAVEALPASGGIVRLANKRYQPSYSLDSIGLGAGIEFLAKPNVSIIGERTPQPSSDYSTLEGGTIINGPLQVSADGFFIDKVGMDSGQVVCDALWASATPDAFAFIKFGGEPDRRDLRIGEISGLGYAVSSPSHGVLIESVTGVQFGSISAYRCGHGVVIKGQRVIGDRVYAVGNGIDGLIIKSNAYSVMREVSVGQVIASSIDGSVDAGYGVFILAETAEGAIVNIGSIQAIRKASGLVAYGTSPYSLREVNIGQLVTEYCTTGISYVGGLEGVSVGSAICKQATVALDVGSLQVDGDARVGSLMCDGFFVGINAVGKARVDSAHFKDLANLAVQYSASGNIRLGDVAYDGSPSPHNASFTFVNGWVSGARPVTIDVRDGKVRLSGIAVPGSAAQLISGFFPATLDPISERRFIVPGFNGATLVPVEIVVGSDGTVSATNYTAAPTGVYLDGVEWDQNF